jgi:hypothetical protein
MQITPEWLALPAITEQLNRLTGLSFTLQPPPARIRQAVVKFELCDPATGLHLTFIPQLDKKNQEPDGRCRVELCPLHQLNGDRYTLSDFSPSLADLKTVFTIGRNPPTVAYQIFNKVLGEGAVVTDWRKAVNQAKAFHQTRQSLLALKRYMAGLVKGELCDSFHFCNIGDGVGFRSGVDEPYKITGQIGSEGFQLLFEGLSQEEAIELIQAVKSRRGSTAKPAKVFP